MKLLLVREPFPTHTYGRLYIDGMYECETLEDIDRRLEEGGEKVYGETCIPRGTYKVIIDWSNRFGKEMLHLLDVPQYEGVRIHALNWVTQTEGCVGVGSGRGMLGGKPAVLNSRHTTDILFTKIDAALQLGEEVWIEIR